MHTLLKYVSRNPYVMPRKQFSSVWLVTFLSAAAALLWLVFFQEPSILHLTWPSTPCQVTRYAYDARVTNGYICEYSVGNATYSILTHGSTQQGTSEQNIGVSHTVLYNPSNPQQGYSPEVALPAYIALLLAALGLAIAMITAGVIAWRKNISRTRVISRLLKTGTAIQATVVGTSLEYASRGMAITTIHIAPLVAADNVRDKYTSDKVWSHYEWLKPGVPARIFVSKENPDDYYVDLDFWEEYFAK